MAKKLYIISVAHETVSKLSLLPAVQKTGLADEVSPLEFGPVTKKEGRKILKKICKFLNKERRKFLSKERGTSSGFFVVYQDSVGLQRNSEHEQDEKDGFGCSATLYQLFPKTFFK